MRASRRSRRAPSTRRHSPAVRVLGLLAAPMVLAACANTTESKQIAKPVVGLPAGALETLVIQPGEAPAGQLPLLKETGPANAAKIASFAADPTAEAAALAAHGFVQAYVVEYANLTAGTELIVTVSQYATASGAATDLSADLAEKPAAGATTLTLAPVGDQSGAVSEPLPGGAKGAELVSVRFRVGLLTYLVAVGAPGAVSPQGVLTVADTLATRARASALSTSVATALSVAPSTSGSTPTSAPTSAPASASASAPVSVTPDGSASP